MSRSVHSTSSASSSTSGRVASRTATTAITAATRHTAPRNTKDAFRPPAWFTTGSASAANAPPSGIAVCRTPSASPRWETENHCITARPLAALTLAPIAPATVSSTTSMLERARPTRRGREHSASGEPAREHEPLADPVREQPPRQQRQDRPDPDGREREPDLRQRQVVVVPKRRREHRQPDQERGEGRLRRRPGRKHHPSVAAVYSPKGLKGFGLVETITLFVSR